MSVVLLAPCSSLQSLWDFFAWYSLTLALEMLGPWFIMGVKVKLHAPLSENFLVYRPRVWVPVIFLHMTSYVTGGKVLYLSVCLSPLPL